MIPHSVVVLAEWYVLLQGETMTGEEFREAVLHLIDPRTTKLWLTKVHGHRLDFICSIGSEQLKPVETVLRDGEYILLGQHIPPDRESQLRDLFERFVQQQVPSDVVPLF